MPKYSIIGLYDPTNRYESTPIHEFTHALGLNIPQLQQIKKIINKALKFGPAADNSPFLDGKRTIAEYYNDPTEVYARLMEERYLNNLNPKAKITKEMLRKMKENNTMRRHSILDQYDDDTLLKLFNEIAQNNNLDTKKHKSIFDFNLGINNLV